MHKFPSCVRKVEYTFGHVMIGTHDEFSPFEVRSKLKYCSHAWEILALCCAVGPLGQKSRLTINS